MEDKNLSIMKLEYEFYSGKAEMHYNAVESTIRLYFVLIGALLTIWAYIYKDNISSFDICNLNPIIKFTTFILLVIGILSFLKVAEHRLLIIAYVKSLNGIRKWFVDNTNTNIENYFIYKADTQNPPFYRRNRHFYWELLGLAFLNSIWIVLLLNTFIPQKVSFFVLPFACVATIWLQINYYKRQGIRKEKTLMLD